MFGDGHGVEARHVGDPHPFVGGRVKVDVVDAGSELLDEAEAPRPIARPGSGDQSETTTSTGGPPSSKRPSSWPWPTTSITKRPARLEGRVLRHLGPGVVLGEPLFADEHPQRPPMGLVSSPPAQA